MGIVTDWSKYEPYFSEKEFKCSHTGECLMQEAFMDILMTIREEYGKPMTITSGYRHPSHPIEVRKAKAGEHSLGMCADIGVSGKEALDIISIALDFGITRLGVNQKGSGRFIHLGIGGADHLPNPHVWSY